VPSVSSLGISRHGHLAHLNRTGTGLIIGTGKALAQAGPGSIFISYTVVGFLVYLVVSLKDLCWSSVPTLIETYRCVL
jgi:amino acid permease